MIAEIDASQFSQEVLASPVPVLVDFFTPNCAPCKMVLPAVEEIAAERANVAKVVKFNAAAGMELAARFRVSAVPNFILFQGGNPVAQRVGRVTKRDLLELIDSAVATQ